MFRRFDEAVDYTDTNNLFQSGQADFQIIELIELEVPPAVADRRLRRDVVMRDYMVGERNG